MSHDAAGVDGPPGDSWGRVHWLASRWSAGSSGLPAAKTAKHLLELKTSVTVRADQVSGRPSSRMAPARQNQLSISCWPASTISLPVTVSQAAQSPLTNA